MDLSAVDGASFARAAWAASGPNAPLAGASAAPKQPADLPSEACSFRVLEHPNEIVTVVTDPATGQELRTIPASAMARVAAQQLDQLWSPAPSGSMLDDRA